MNSPNATGPGIPTSATPPSGPFSNARSWLHRTHERHRHVVAIALFICGFAFDAAVLHRIDAMETLVQQAAYLVVCAVLVGVELREAAVGELAVPRWLSRVWSYRTGFMHFLLGTLLNSYTIFYSKSASGWASLGFITILVAVLALNEWRPFDDSRVKVHVVYLSLCLCSYLVSLVPILLGFIGALPFLLSLGVATVIAIGYYHLVRPFIGDRRAFLRSHLTVPYLGTAALFFALFFTNLIPPVPLSVSYLGIFHDVHRTDDGYVLSSLERPGDFWPWNFWRRGDRTFRARPGDPIHAFVRVYSPASFRERLMVRWLYRDPRAGWMGADAIPIAVEGGREEGFRADLVKRNYAPGDWSIRIETTDGREVGHLGFRIEEDTETTEREFRTEIQ